MNPLALPCLILVGVNLCAGAVYLLFYFSRGANRAHLPFALLCFSVAAYDAACAGLYTATGLTEGIAWQRLQFAAFVPIAVCTAWFLGLVTEAGLNRVHWTMMGAFTLLGAVPLALGDRAGLTLSIHTPAVKHLRWGSRELITYYESEAGMLYVVGMVAVYLAYFYLLPRLVRAYRREPTQHLLAVIVGQAAYLAGLLHDGLVAAGVYSFLYVSEYTYLVVVGTMAYALLRQYVGLHQAVEELNRSLERRVQEALADIGVLRGMIPICAACKKIRDDQGFWSQVEVYISQRSDATFSHGICPDCIERLYPEYAARLREG